jgi:hypothetical protein
MPVDITEYRAMARDDRAQVVPCGLEPALTNQQLTAGGASTPSAAFGAATRFVRVHADEDVRIAFGANPVASAASPRMAANSTEYFGVVAGQKVAVIAT